MSYAHAQAHQNELHRLREALLALEDKAGVREEHQRFSGTDSGNELRHLYFSVRDKELRKQLIAGYRDLIRHDDGSIPARMRDAEDDIRALEGRGFSPPWIWPSAIAAVAVCFGWAIASLPGALAGAVAGFFAGNAYVAERRNAHRRELRAARAELADLTEAREDEKHRFGNPLVFSDEEEQSGSEDEGRQPEPNLHWFARAGWDRLVARELANGADVEAENNEAWGSRPLHRACAAGNAAIAKMLLDAGADPNAPNRLHGFTPLHSAAAAGSAETARLLIAAGASVNARDRYGFLPLHRAAESSDAETLRALAQAGSPIEEPADAEGNRPLHIAARLGHPEAVEALLSLGADPSATNAHGATPLDLTSYGKGTKFEQTVDLLEKAGGRRVKSQGPKPEGF